MIRPVLFVLLSFTTAAFARAQASGATAERDPNPNVFLDNHRPAISKKDKPPTTRSLSGKVVDDTGQPLEGALVTLTDGKTHVKTTAFTKKDGRYNFDALSFNNDYELQARYKDSVSTPRKLSQYDHNANVVRILEIETDTPEAKK
jgi:Carboxypeptidase regulatory-like domain